MTSTDDVLDTLPSEEELTAKCLELGLIMRQSPSFNITHPAVTLRPLPMKFEVLEQLYDRQLLWNEAINRTARSFAFLRDAMKSTADSDRDFTGRLVTMLENVYLTAPPGASAPVFQPLMLGIFRTDYMRSVDPEPSSTQKQQQQQERDGAATPVPTVNAVEHEAARHWKNIEINTISCSFAGLSPLVQQFHTYLDKYRASCVCSATALGTAKSLVIASAASRDGAVHTADHCHDSSAQVPASLATAVAAWQHAVPLTSFLQQYKQRTGVVLKPIVLVVVQENERNTADQYKLLLALLERHGVLSIRRTLTQLHDTMRLEHATGGNHSRQRTAESSTEAVEQPLPPFAVVEDRFVVAVAYFRSTYVPEDFPTEATWQSRAAIEKSNAVKCPSIPYHLMTFKKMQQLMSNVSEVLTPVSFAGDMRKAEAMAEHFVPQYSLNKDDYTRFAGHRQKNDAGEVIDDPEYWIRDAADHPEKYVLKPQLEGGGNLIAGINMQRMLRETKPEDPLYHEIRREYILMRKIHYPVTTGIFFRQNKVQVIVNNVCSELGIYGITLSAEGGKYLLNEAAGCVVRSKPADVEDGGVMAGVAALDSVLLIKKGSRCSAAGGRWCCCCCSRGMAAAGAVVTVASVAVAVAAWAAKQHQKA